MRTLGGEDGNGGEGHASTVWCASFEPRALDDGRVGKRCVTCGGDGQLIVWNGKGFCNTDLEFGTRFECGHDRAVLSCSWGRNGLVAAGGGDNSIRLYGEVDGTWREVVKVENAHDDDVNHVEWSPHDSSLLVSASDDWTVTIWLLSLRYDSATRDGHRRAIEMDRTTVNNSRSLNARVSITCDRLDRDTSRR